MQPIDFSVFNHLRVSDAGESQAWLVRLPRMIWNHPAADKERRSLVDRLTIASSRRSLWLGDLATDGKPHWHGLTNSDNVFELDELNEGGWALLFFGSESAMPMPPMEHLPADASSLKRLLSRLSASAAIVSFVDDDEWLVAFAT
jgi:hypothetical protein